MRDNLNKYIIYDKYFPSNPQKAIANGFIYAEKIFFKNYTGLDSSGSCAIVVLIIENRVYIANVGDSRAILSAKNGSKFYTLSRDHRPGNNDVSNKNNIRNFSNIINNNSTNSNNIINNNNKNIINKNLNPVNNRIKINTNNNYIKSPINNNKTINNYKISLNMNN